MGTKVLENPYSTSPNTLENKKGNTSHLLEERGGRKAQNMLAGGKNIGGGKRASSGQ